MLDILYEDADLLVVNKPAGVAAHDEEGGRMSDEQVRDRIVDRIAADFEPRKEHD